MTRTVRDNSERRRYELEVDGGIAFIDYRRNGEVVTLTHAEVPHALRGGGVGSELVQGALALARQRGDTVVPLCSFVEHYLRRHPEAHDLLAAPDGFAQPLRPP
ncbi:MAG TPA: GNAT family N-acetyltransferase [Steroidobacteraceae bacterium]|jgi:hypothetical protein|nr:GNAT family N-acetyltransferase [Steroidobacteraceae bacterium]